jgi:hypothetical protein
MYAVVNNPIPKSNLFTSPTLEEIQGFIANLPKKEQANANLVFMFTLNSCHALVEKEIPEILE